MEGLKLNQLKFELALFNQTRDEALQTEVMFREVVTELRIITLSNSSLSGAPLADRVISYIPRETLENLESMTSKLILIKIKRH